MKKRKGILMVLLTVVLSVIMIMGTTVVSAFADTYEEVTSGNVNLVSKMYYGKESKLSGATRIVTPSGKELTDDLTGFTPTEIGAYTVYFGDASYVVPCVLNTEYELRVAHNGADIPTYMAAGGSFDVPTASVWETDDNPLSDYGYKKSEQKVTWEIQGPKTIKNDDASKSTNVTLEAAGTYTVRYTCQIEGGSKFLTKDYTVKVQDKFEDTEAPKLNVVNIPKEISVNAKVDLPRATATDNYDSNVKVEITVTDPDGAKVKHVALNEHGYAVVKEDAEEVVFENDYNLSFYPTKLGVYKISYRAYDDSGKSTLETQHNYTTTVVDKTAPKLVKIAEEQIPSTWGKEITVKGEKEGETTTLTTEEDTNIVFPYPEYVDNNDKDVTVAFKITDSTNNKTVISFDNIYATEGDGATYKYDANRQSNGLYNDGSENGVKFTEEGLTFNFKYYADNLDDSLSPYGKYTVTYTARDTKPLTTSTSYEIVYEEKFSDTVAPSITEIKKDVDYLLFNEYDEDEEGEDFIVPTPVISDNVATRIDVKYYLTAGELPAEIDEDNTIVLNGGETVKYKLVSGVPTVTLTDKLTQKTQTVTFSGTEDLYLTVVATDNVGNSDSKSVSIKVLNAKDANYTTLPTVDFSGLNDPSTMGIKQGKPIKAGSFEIKNLASEVREYTGFEVALVLDDKVWVNGDISLTTYYDYDKENNSGTLVVKDIEFSAPQGKLELYIRIFNITGLSKIVKVSYGDIAANKPGDGMGAALQVPTSGSVYTTYQLRNKHIDSTPEDVVGGKEYIVRKIDGKGKFSLMSSLFTAYNVGTFNFTDGYYAQAEGNEEGVFTPLNKVPSYPLAVKENATPAWQMLGSIQSYSKKDKEITLPQVLATSDYANAKVELSILDPDGNKLTMAKDESDNAGKQVTFNNDGLMVFTPSKDGTYKLTYTASYGESQTLSQTFNISVGDVEPPKFEIDGTHASRVVENSKFNFNKVIIQSDADKNDISKVRFVKNLKDPSGNVVYTTDGNGTTYQNRTTDSSNEAYTFTKSGNYTVEYVVYDKVGNSAIKTYTITVGAAKVNNPISTKIISTILIIVGVILLASVILYFVRFRKVKNK